MTQSERDIRHNTVWSFETDRFFVGFYAELEDEDPSDQFDEIDVAAIREGRVDYFCAVIRVYLKSDDAYSWEEIGWDYLGSCAYRHASDFRDGSYFPGMVREACRMARQSLARMGGVATTLRAGVA